jgi:hypothetical protein
MLAYVFWHWRQPSVDARVYEPDLAQFHQTLRSNKPIGFQRSVVFQINDAAWLNTNGPAYEEWYLLDDSAAMDRINYAAVNGPCEDPHNRVARNAAGGVGGLYRLRAGSEVLERAKFATWFSKPPGVSYTNLDAQLQPMLSGTDATLWTRQMVLGPTTEFCLHSTSNLSLPTGFSGTRIPLKLLWSE